ncbi:MAG: LptF/LptG family permease, partial [Selenomonadaceae bacterium]|nr:LptF/LptG family permease [Selenomonadaceae bacterium]
IVKELNGDRMERLIYAREYKAQNEILEGVTMQLFNEEGKVTHVENATYAEWRNEQWVMHDGMIYDFSDDERTRTMKFDQQILPVKASPRQIVREQKKTEELTMSELKAQIAIMKSQYVNTNKLETELYQRVTVPMASLIFALIGVPLGLQPTRTPSSMGFALSVLIIFLYYAVMTLANAIARGGAIPPMYAVWIPNVIGLFAGFVLIYRASR